MPTAKATPKRPETILAQPSATFNQKTRNLPRTMDGFSRISNLDPGDYYHSEEGYIVFTEQYHLKRGHCCQNLCKHCPWEYAKKLKERKNSSGNQS